MKEVNIGGMNFTSLLMEYEQPDIEDYIPRQ